MSKRIEKEPDGYIRDLQRKRRKEIKWIIAWNAFLLAIPVFIFSLFLITALAPIPDVLITETHVFQKYVEKESYKTGGHPAYFVSTFGDCFAIRFAEADDFVVGKAYEISYKAGIFHTWAYTISDGEEMIISINDHISYRNENISNLPKEALICFGLYLLVAIPVNIFIVRFMVKNVCEINDKIEKRRKRRNQPK